MPDFYDERKAMVSVSGARIDPVARVWPIVAAGAGNWLHVSAGGGISDARGALRSQDSRGASAER